MTSIPADAGGASPAEPTVRWKDSKRYLWLLGLAVPMLPAAAYAWSRNTGWPVFFWLGPLWVFVLIPIADTVFGTDTSNPPDWAVPQLERDRYYRWCTYLYFPLQYASLVLAAWVVTTHDLSWVDSLGLALTVGVVGGVGIANAHELGHKTDKLERRLSKLVLAQTAYTHFFVEHNRGHHVRVATPEDPASARLGESFWAFLPRTVVGSMQSAWRLETARLRAQHKRVWSLENDLLTGWGLTIALFGGLTVGFGPRIVPFLVLQAVVGFCLLEVVNYVEHYGLLRPRRADGSYERCQPSHSWNSNHVGSNVFLYHLERHSDHHAFPTRRYQALRHFDESPQLPTGYAGMILLAMVPPLWRRVMDHRVVEHYGGHIELANVQPSKRTRIVAG
ncbi:MAG: alkane 1-monooxygenase [Acidimicrobiia bacterium]